MTSEFVSPKAPAAKWCSSVPAPGSPEVDSSMTSSSPDYINYSWNKKPGKSSTNLIKIILKCISRPHPSLNLSLGRYLNDNFSSARPFYVQSKILF